MKLSSCIATAVVIFYVSGIGSAAVIHVPGDQPTIQAGIDAAVDGDTVLVADGTYTGAGNKNLTWNGDVKHITVKSENGPDNCVIDCENSGRGFKFDETNQDDTDVVNGFTIQNGYVTGGGSEGAGGGIWCYRSSPVIAGCTILGNSAENSGGGIRCIDSTPTITGCTISKNSAQDGGGIFSGDCSSSNTITGCTISENTAEYDGGGICCSTSAPTITGCTISGNSAEHRGGGIDCDSNSSPTITDCTITGNSAEDHGGGIRCNISSSPAITGCTISGNSAGDHGGGISCDLYCFPTITDCIFWNDTAGEDGDEIALLATIHPSALTISYSDVQGGQEAVYVHPICTLNWGSGMIDEDPLFVAGPEGDFYLSQTAAGQAENSPCVDTGGFSASNICFEGPDGEICMDELWTRTDEIADTGQVDMGYHYGIESYFSTPTPVSTNTPTMPPTQTPVSTHVPTMSPTPTPVSTHAPTMSPTQTVIPGIAVDLRLSKTTFTPGDLFLLNAYISNSGPQTYTQQPFAVLLYVYGIYFWHPNWTEEFDYEGIDLGIGSPAFTEEILRFNWPEESCLGSAICYGALLNESCSEILGDWDFIEFEWMP